MIGLLNDDNYIRYVLYIGLIQNVHKVGTKCTTNNNHYNNNYSNNKK